MLWEESKVNTYEHNCEVELSSPAVKGVSCKEGESVNKAGEDSKDGAY